MLTRNRDKERQWKRKEIAERKRRKGRRTKESDIVKCALLL